VKRCFFENQKVPKGIIRSLLIEPPTPRKARERGSTDEKINRSANLLPIFSCVVHDPSRDLRKRKRRFHQTKPTPTQPHRLANQRPCAQDEMQATLGVGGKYFEIRAITLKSQLKSENDPDRQNAQIPRTLRTRRCGKHLVLLYLYRISRTDMGPRD